MDMQIRDGRQIAVLSVAGSDSGGIKFLGLVKIFFHTFSIFKTSTDLPFRHTAQKFVIALGRFVQPFKRLDKILFRDTVTIQTSSEYLTLRTALFRCLAERFKRIFSGGKVKKHCQQQERQSFFHHDRKPFL